MSPGKIAAIAIMFPLALGSVSAAELSKADQEYLRDRARTLMVDVQAGQLGSKTATTDEVRAFAYRLLNDHQRALDNVRKLAAARKLEIPAAPTERDLKAVTRLKGMTGVKFDEAFIRRSISAHKDGTNEDRKRMYGTKDPELRALASASYEVETAHLALANRAMASIRVR
jgi:putative membrane protein